MTPQHDHALALYPVPHVLVLADSVAADWTRFEGCDVFNPVRRPPCGRQRRCPCECMSVRFRTCVQRIIGESFVWSLDHRLWMFAAAGLAGPST